MISITWPIRALPLALLVGCAATPPAPVVPLQGPPLAYSAPYLAAPPTLDGRLDDAVWRNVPWTESFADIEGPSKPTPRYRTRAKIAWDDRYLYIAADMEEPDVWATYDRRDMIVFHENDFEVFIDPTGDGAEYYELEVNCLGTIFDLFLPRKYRDGGPAVHDWDCEGLVTAIDVVGTMNDPRDEDVRWTLEWAIPWSCLVPPDRDDEGRPLPPSRGERARGGRAPEPGEVWRINFSRVQWTHNHETLDADGRRVRTRRSPDAAPYAKLPDLREDNWTWSPQWMIDMHLPDRWGFVRFERSD